MKKFGIFGGTFNPPHIAHSIAAQSVMTQFSLDKMIFIPTGNHPLKNSLPAEHRLAMAELAFGDNSKFEISNIEIKSGDEKSYTVDTLEKIRVSDKINYIENNITYFLIIGTDNLLTLDKWKNPERLFELAEVTVINRPGFDSKESSPEFLEKVNFVNIPYMDISSSSIRKMVMENMPVKYLVSSEVEKYIFKNKLYKK